MISAIDEILKNADFTIYDSDASSNNMKIGLRRDDLCHTNYVNINIIENDTPIDIFVVRNYYFFMNSNTADHGILFSINGFNKNAIKFGSIAPNITLIDYDNSNPIRLINDIKFTAADHIIDNRKHVNYLEDICLTNMKMRDELFTFYYNTDDFYVKWRILIIIKKIVQLCDDFVSSELVSLILNMLSECNESSIIHKTSQYICEIINKEITQIISKVMDCEDFNNISISDIVDDPL